MADVIMKKGLFANLPIEAEDNVLFYCTDTGNLYQGGGIGQPLVDYGSVLTGYHDLADLKIENPQQENKVYLTDDGKLHIYDGVDYKTITSDGHTHGNNPILDKFGENQAGDLTYNGNPLTGNIYVAKKRVKLNVAQNGQTVFDTGVDIGTHPLNQMNFKLTVNGQDLVDEITPSLKPNTGEVVITWNNLYELSTTDDVYLSYSKNQDVTNTYVTSVNGHKGDVTIDANSLNVYTKNEVAQLLNGKADSNALTGGINAVRNDMEDLVKEVTYNQFTNRITVTKKNNTSTELDLSGLAGGGGGGGAGGAVDSVNGMTGVVVLNAGHVGAYTQAEVNNLLNGKANTADVNNLVGQIANKVDSIVYNNDKQVIEGNITDVENDLADANREITTLQGQVANKLDTATYNADKQQIDTKINDSVRSVTFNPVDNKVTITKHSGTTNEFTIPTGGGAGGTVTSVNGETGDVDITPAKLNVYTKTETDGLLNAKLDKADLTTELNKKVDVTDYEVYKNSNDAKVNASIKKVAFDDASNELVVTTTDNKEEKVDLSALASGSSSMGVSSREW